MKSTLAQVLEDFQIGEELFWEPIRQAQAGAWTGHLATAFWLTKAVHPSIFVELGTHSGNSYSAFCQAISQLGLPVRAFAVDTWQGDEQSGFYGEDVYRELVTFNETHYHGFSKLLRATFDEARAYFQDGTVDLLHIDGLHTYEAVKHDFENWKTALSDRAVVIFHDSNVRKKDFGVWKLWLELAASYPSFEFHHSEGLGVLGVGQKQPELLRRLFHSAQDPDSAAMLRLIFASRGELFRSRSQTLDLAEQCSVLSSELQVRAKHVSDLEGGLAHAGANLQEHLQELAKHGELIRALESQVSCRDAVLSERQQEIRAQSERISHLQRELVACEYDLTGREAKLQRANQIIHQKDQLLSIKKNEIAEAREAALKNQESERLAASQQIEQLQKELFDAKRQLGLIESSSSWKLVSRVRSPLQNFPTARGYVRRIARVIWWTLTFQLFRRLRARRRLFEMRDSIAKSALFDAAWYLSQNLDVVEAGCDPALHYALFGAIERRSPGPRFDAKSYLQRNPDVAEAGINPLVHYLQYGASEGREITAVGASLEKPDHPSERLADMHKHDYLSWVSRYDTLTDEDRTAVVAHIQLLHECPTISIVMPVYNTDPLFLGKALDSVRAQLYPFWELCIADDASSRPELRSILDDYARRDRRIKLVYRSANGHISAASNSALELATGTHIALMDHDDELPEHALYMVAVCINEHPESDIIYSDEDKIDSEGTRQSPYFKPDWNPELFYSQNYLSHLGVYRAALVREVGGFREGYEGSQDYDLALRIVARTKPERIRHISHILYHWRTAPGVSTFSIDNLPTAVQASRRALADFFAARGEDVQVIGGRLPQFNRVIRSLPDPLPLVSIIIPTRDRLSLLRGCVDGLLQKTDYDNLEIIVVDNDSKEIETRLYLNRLKNEFNVRVLRIDGEFNYSALNNRAVDEASGDLIAFLNNDIEVIHPSWLKEMVSQLIQSGVGAVGAKLYYADNTIQHAGVILGLGGVAGHSHLRQPRSDAGYFGRLLLEHEVSCVTGACMLMHKQIFREVGGFDEERLKIAFNDVDLCLKIRQAGYRIIWTPYAELYHLESASRGYDFDPDRIARITAETDVMAQRWQNTLERDPFYNPNLSLVASENHKPAFPPRSEKPWNK